MKLSGGQVMQEDKDQKHRSKSTTEWLIHKKKNALWSGPVRVYLIHIIHPNNIAEQTQFLKRNGVKFLPTIVQI